MNKINKGTMPFFPIIEKLENTLNHSTDIDELISLISKSQFLSLRASIVSVFEVGETPNFEGVFVQSVEFGDVSDAVRGVTFSQYPQNTETNKPISLEERKEWCTVILNALDDVTV